MSNCSIKDVVASKLQSKTIEMGSFRFTIGKYKNRKANYGEATDIEYRQSILSDLNKILAPAGISVEVSKFNNYYDAAIAIVDKGMNHTAELPSIESQMDVVRNFAGNIIKEKRKGIITPNTVGDIKSTLLNFVRSKANEDTAAKDNWAHVLKYFYTKDGVEGYWDKAITHLQSKYRFSEDLDVDDLGLFIKRYDASVMESSRKSTMGTSLKEALSIFEIDERDKFLGEKKFLEFEPIYNKLLVEMSGKHSIEEMEDSLRRLSTINPVFGYILSKIDVANVAEGEDVNNKNLLRNAFYSTFRNNFANITFNIAYKDETTGEFGIKSIVGNQSTPEMIIMKGWRSDYNTKFENEDKKVNEANKEEIVKLGDALNKALIKVSDFDSYNQAVKLTTELLNKLGYTIKTGTKDITEFAILNEFPVANYEGSANKFNEAAKDIQSKLYLKSLLYIIKHISENKKVFTASYDSNESETGAIKLIVDRFKSYDDYIYETVSSNIAGDNIWMINQPSYLTDLVSLFNTDSEAKRGKLRDFLFNFKKAGPNELVNLFYVSNWIPGFFHKDGTFNLENTDKLKIFLNGGGRNDENREANKISAFSNKDIHIGVVNQYITYSANEKDKNKVRFTPPTPSDASTNWVVEYNRIPVNPEGTHATKNQIDLIADLSKYGTNLVYKFGKLSVDSPMYKALLNNLKREVIFMNQARELLFNRNDQGEYHPKIEALYKDDFESAIKGLSKEDQDYYREKRKELLPSLVENFHYKKLDSKTKEPVPFEKSTENSKGKATGNVFKFQYFNSINNKKALFNEYGLITDALTSYTKIAIQNRVRDILSSGFNTYLSYNLDAMFKSRAKDIAVRYGNTNTFNHTAATPFNHMLMDMLLNHAIFTVEWDTMLASSPAQYKSKVDTIKREKQINAQHIKTNSVGNQRILCVDDPVITSGILPHLTEEFEKEIKRRKPFADAATIKKEAAALLHPYTDITTTDGITLTRPSTYFKAVADRGIFPSNAREAKLAEDIVNDKYKSNDNSVAFQMQKPFYYDLRWREDLRNYFATQIKNAEIALWPNMIRDTPYEKLLNWMEENNVDKIVLRSAFKVGASAIADIVDENGIISEEKLNNSVHLIQEISQEGFGIQQDKVAHDESKLGIQPQKLLISGLRPDVNYKMEDGSSLNGPALYNFHLNLHSSIIEASAKQLSRMTGDSTGNFNRVDHEMLASILLSGQNVTVGDRQALETLNGSFVIPLIHPTSTVKYEPVIMASFTTKVSTLRTFGPSAAQAPAQFFKFFGKFGDRKRVADIKEYQDRIEFTKEKLAEIKKSGKFKLNASVKADGEVGNMEVLLPATAKEFFNKEGKRTFTIDEIPKELREFIGYRIPSQGKYSASVIEVVGFLPSEAGHTVIIPEELMVRAGSDFDIDVLYTSGYKLYKENGIVKQIPYITGNSEKDVMKRYALAFHSLKNSEEGKRAYNELLSTIPSIEEDLKRIEESLADKRKLGGDVSEYYMDTTEAYDAAVNKSNDLAKVLAEINSEESEDISNIITDYTDSIVDKNKIKNNLKEAVRILHETKRDVQELLNEKSSLKNAMDTFLLNHFIETQALLTKEEFSRQSIVDQNSVEAKHNQMVSNYKSILHNGAHFLEQSNPTSFQEIKDLSNKYKSKEYLNKSDDDFDRQNIAEQSEKKAESSLGKNLIAITANANAYVFTMMKDANSYFNSVVTPALGVKYTKNQIEGRGYNWNAWVKSVEEKYGIDNVIVKGNEVIIKNNKIGWNLNKDNTNIYGNSIDDHYSMVIGAATDAVKDPTFADIGINSFTIDAATALIATGHGWDFVAALLDSPSVLNVVRAYGNKSIFEDPSKADKASLISKINKEIENYTVGIETVKKITNSDLDLKTAVADGYAVSVEELDKAIRAYNKTKDATDLDYLTTQWLALNLFKNALIKGKDLSANMFRVDSQKVGPSTTNTYSILRDIQRAKESSEVLVADGSEMGVRFAEAVFPNDGRESIYKILQSILENSNKNSIKMMSNLHFKDLDGFRGIVDRLSNVLDISTKEDRENFEKKFTQFATSYFASGFGLFNLSRIDYKALFFDLKNKEGESVKKSLWSRIEDLRESRPDLFSTDGFLSNLEGVEEIVSGFKVKRIKIKESTRGLGEDTKARLMSDFESLLGSTKSAVQDIAIDLVIYAMMDGGLVPSPSSFTELIPPSFYKESGYGEYLNSVLADLQRRDNMAAYVEMTESFLKHNAERNLIPKASNSREFQGVRMDVTPTMVTKQGDKKVSNVYFIKDAFAFGNSNAIKNGRAVYITIPDGNRNHFVYKLIGNDESGVKYYRPIGRLGIRGLNEFASKSVFFEQSPRMVNAEKTDLEIKDMLSKEYGISITRSITAEQTATPKTIDKEIVNGVEIAPIPTSAGNYDYKERTHANVRDTDATLDFSHKNTTGAKDTYDAALTNKKLFIGTAGGKGIDTISGFLKFNTSPTEDSINEISNALIEYAKKNNITSVRLNIAGHGMTTIAEWKRTQKHANNYMYMTLKGVIEKLGEKGIRISAIRTGGQTGFDEAGIMAAKVLNIPVEVHATLDWKFRIPYSQIDFYKDLARNNGVELTNNNLKAYKSQDYATFTGSKALFMARFKGETKFANKIEEKVATANLKNKITEEDISNLIKQGEIVYLDENRKPCKNWTK